MLAQQVLNGVINGSVYALVALGLTMVYGVLKILHFAHGAVYMIGAYFALFFLQQVGLPFWPSAALALILSAAVGAVMEYVAYRPLRSASRLSSLIAGIALYFLLEDVFRHAWGPYALPFEAGVQTIVYRVGSLIITNVQILILGAAAGLVVVLHLFLQHTYLGSAMQAVAQDAGMAAMCGVPVNRIVTLNFAIGSATAAMAGVLVALYFNEVFPSMGEKAIEKAFALVVLGGLGNIPGCVVAGLILGVAESLAVGYLDLPLARDAMAFVLLILILLYRPYGIFGTRVPRT